MSKKINYLTATKELKSKIENWIKEILENDQYFCWDHETKSRKQFVYDYTYEYGYPKPLYTEKFLTSYSGCTMFYNHIYNILVNALEYFEDNNFATAGKLVREYIDREIEDLNNEATLCLNNMYSKYLEDHEKDEDNYITHEYPNGEEYYEYIQPTYDDFLENMCDHFDYTSDYEDYNNMTWAADELCEYLGYYIW